MPSNDEPLHWKGAELKIHITATELGAMGGAAVGGPKPPAKKYQPTHRRIRGRYYRLQRSFTKVGRRWVETAQDIAFFRGNLRKAMNIARGLPSPAEIKALRNGLDAEFRERTKREFTQWEASRLLGGGVNGFQKYEAGHEIPGTAMANLLQLLGEYPVLLEDLLKKRAKLDAWATPERIAKTRKSLKLSQNKASAIFGGGPKSFQKYEAGTLSPCRAMKNLVFLLDRYPQLLKKLETQLGSQHQQTGVIVVE